MEPLRGGAKMRVKTYSAPMVQYRLRLLGGGAKEFSSPNDIAARAKARDILAGASPSGAAELWRHDALLRRLTPLGIVPYLVRHRETKRRTVTANSFERELHEAEQPTHNLPMRLVWRAEAG
jgi:hypothetical protein